MKLIKFISVISFLLILIAVISNLSKNQQFKFESFETVSEIQSYLDTKYPRGSNIKLLINDLSKAGANCRTPTEFEMSNNFSKEMIICDYTYGVLMDIEFMIVINQNQSSILEIKVYKTSTAL